MVGDFHTTFGQGLIINGTFSADKSSNVLKVNPSQSGLSHKYSADEYNFFKGAAQVTLEDQDDDAHNPLNREQRFGGPTRRGEA